MELGERNANKTCTYKEQPEQFVILLYLNQKLAKTYFCSDCLCVEHWKAAPCSALPTADENVVTESAVTNCLPACSSQPQFLQRMSSCTAKLLTVKLQYVKQPISVPIVYISSVDN